MSSEDAPRLLRAAPRTADVERRRSIPTVMQGDRPIREFLTSDGSVCGARARALVTRAVGAASTGRPRDRSRLPQPRNPEERKPPEKRRASTHPSWIWSSSKSACVVRSASASNGRRSTGSRYPTPCPPELSAQAVVARTASSEELRLLGGDLLHPALGLVPLLVTDALNVYKPSGLPPYGWRKQQEETISRVRARRDRASADRRS